MLIVLETHCQQSILSASHQTAGSTSGRTPRADPLEVLQGLDDSGSAFKIRFQKLELLIRYATLANSYRPICSLASALCLLGHPDLAAPGQL